MAADALGQGAQRLVLGALNHVLGQHAWARDKLTQFAGRSVRIGLQTDKLPRLPFLPAPHIDARIGGQGLLEALPPSEQVIENPSVEMLLKPGLQALGDFSRNGPQGLLRHMKIEGDVLLAAALGEIASQARWDFEDDLSRVVGDVAARRTGRLVEDARLASQDGAQALKAQYDLLRQHREAPLAVREGLQALDERLASLSARLDALDRDLPRATR